MAARILSPVGGALVVLAVFIPYGEFDGDAVSVLDFDQLRFTVGFALEPLAVAIASLAPLALVRVAPPRAIALVLATAGAQTALLYLGYLLLTTLNEAYEPSLGALVGIAGAALMFVAGVVMLRAPEVAAAPGALPPAGWYQDPGGTAGERFWDGAAWTESTR